MAATIYDNDSDVEAIIAYSKDKEHQEAYKSLGIKISQMPMSTYVFESDPKWKKK